MATALPPPSKRQRVAAAETAKTQQEIDTIPPDLGSIRVQFYDQSSGKPTGGPVSVPVADASVKNLELLVNSLLGNDASERLPYRFSYHRPASETQSSVLDIPQSIYHSLLLPSLATTEDLITLHYTPQAIFRVRAVSRLASTIPGHTSPILTTQFSPQSCARFATGAGDSTARIWDCETGTPLHILKAHTSWVLVVSWSPDGSLLATGSMDNTVRLWDPNTGLPHGGKDIPLKGHTKWVRSLAWEPYHCQHTPPPSLPRLASASKDSTIRIWDTVSKRIEHALSGHKASVSCVRWGGMQRLYSSSQDKTVKIWDPDKGILLSTLTNHAHWVNSIALSTDHALRTAFHDHKTSSIPGTIEAKREKAIKRYEDAATLDGHIQERFVSASDDLTIFLWPPYSPSEKKPSPLARLHGHGKQVNHITFSPSGTLLSSSSFDNTLRVWSGVTGAWLYTLKGHVGPVYMSCFSADSRLLVSASKDTTCKVWDVGGKGMGKGKEGRLKEDLTGGEGEVFAVDWSADGGRVGSGGADGKVRIWRG